MAERISFVTNDEVTIVGDWSPAPTVVGAVILVHMMTVTRASWAIFSRALLKRGLASLAIDLRGHGDSLTGPDGMALDYREFDDAAHQTSIWDVAGAVDWVRSRGIDLNRIALAGASFGSHLCLEELTYEPRMRGAVLLSPGENYRGISSIEEADKLSSDQSLFIASSEEDAQSFAASQALFAQAPITEKIFAPYKGAGHGTDMFTADPKLMEKAADWLLETITRV